MITVCMATYNGERFIEEQLRCIHEQTLKPDEVIICDDNSTDGTRDIISEFICKNALEENWKLIHNQERRGYPNNFYYCMGLAKGDVVFLADQDDVWCETKLERMCRVLDEHQETKVVSCKFGLIDAKGTEIRTIMAPVQSKGTGNLRNVTIQDVFYKYEWPGMVVAYRNAWYREWARGDGGSKIPHDFLTCAKAAEEQSFVQIDERLAYHRRHDNNTAKEEHRIKKLLNKRRKLREIEEYLRILERFAEEQVLQTELGNVALQSKRDSMQSRKKALLSGKIGDVLKSAWKYRSEVRLTTVVCDVLIVKYR